MTATHTVITENKKAVSFRPPVSFSPVSFLYLCSAEGAEFSILADVTAAFGAGTKVLDIPDILSQVLDTALGRLYL